jgi:pimeloyl-ACP methyl ester carboxylesterase
MHASPIPLVAPLVALIAALVPLASPASSAPQSKRKPPAERPAQAFETKTRKLKDGIPMTGDWYPVAPVVSGTSGGTPVPGAPVARWGVAVCLHQGAGSRGEYREIAPTLNQLGLDVLAVDLRAGARKFMVENETATAHLEATETPASAADCYDDVVVALKWARELSPGGPLVLLGSAQSAGLAIMAAVREKDAVDALVLFSPGEYVTGVPIWEEAAKLTVPVYATCGSGSKESSWARGTLQKVPEEHLTTFWPGTGQLGLHGAPTLLAGDEANRERQWRGVKDLLERVKPKPDEE